MIKCIIRTKKFVKKTQNKILYYLVGPTGYILHTSHP